VHGAQHDQRVEIRLSPDESAGRSGASQARTIESSRSAGAFGIVTSTVSGWAAAMARSMSRVPP
jgi:hypothetical protein